MLLPSDFILLLRRKVFGQGDIARLAALVTAAQQQDNRLTTSNKIHAISWPKMDAQFTNSAANRLHITRMPKGQPIDPCTDSCAGLQVPLISHPTREHAGLTDNNHGYM